MGRFLLLFCVVLGGLFAIEMLKPVQEAVIQPFTGLLAALSTAFILPFDDTVIAKVAYCEMRQPALRYRLRQAATA